MSDTHQHKFEDVGIQTVMGDDSIKYRQEKMDSQYSGVPMALVYHLCKCGAKQPFEYGKRTAMMKLAKQIAGKEPTKVPSLKV